MAPEKDGTMETGFGLGRHAVCPPGILPIITMKNPQAMRSTTAIIAVLLVLSQTAAADLLGDVHPLAPLDSSGPRETLKSFQDALSESISAYQSEADWSATDAERYMLDLSFKASRLLDLSGLPSAQRDDVMHLGVVQLQEILDRIELPAYADIPDRAQAEVAGIDRWTIPRTEITIARVEDGANRGKWLFSPETVSRLGEFYEKVQDIPYKNDAILARLGDDVLLYEYMLYSPDAVIPLEWFNNLPPWANDYYGDLLIWQIIGAVIVLLAAITLVMIVFRIVRRLASKCREHPIAQAWLRTVPPVVSAVVFYVTEFVIDDQLSLCCAPQAVLETTLLTLMLFFIAWTIVAVGNVVAELIVQSPRIHSESVDASLVRIIARVVSLLMAIWVLLHGVESFGISFIPLIAGLGIGGFAIALAVRPTLENVIGGFILFADRPVRVGDFCRFGDQVGTIEEIGIRSTRIRTLADTVLSVPNAEFSQLRLENFAKRSRILYRSTIGLRYETTPDQLRHVLARLRETFLGHPKVASDNLRIRFRKLGKCSLEIETFAYIRTKIWLEFIAIREDLNLRIMDVVNDSGTKFALPSQTTYFARDAGMDGARTQAAEDQVAEWRRGNQLPFPEFEEGQHREIEDVLDYPPSGSPHHAPAQPRESPPSGMAGRGGKR